MKEKMLPEGKTVEEASRDATFFVSNTKMRGRKLEYEWHLLRACVKDLPFKERQWYKVPYARKYSEIDSSKSKDKIVS